MGIGNHSKAIIKPLPPKLRRGMEKITGINLSDVRVFYHSSKPAQVQAHAYAQGRNIYISSGQEHHLPHELGHIVQQAKGSIAFQLFNHWEEPTRRWKKEDMDTADRIGVSVVF